MQPRVVVEPRDYGRGVACYLGEERVSHVMIVDLKMRIGPAHLRIGGIGGVSTPPDHRNRGYSRMCMEAAVEYMSNNGFDMSFLFGIRDFYHKYGYITCMPDHTYTMDTRDGERAVAVHRHRPMTGKDAAEVARMYNRDYGHLTGSVVRFPANWEKFHKGSGWRRKVTARVILDGDRIVGYVAYDDETDACVASEIGGRSGEVFNTALNILARRAVQLRREQITFSLPADNRFGQWARRFGIRIDIRYPRNGGGMGRITDLTATFEKLQDLLSTRIGGVPDPQNFAIETDIGKVSLKCTRNGVRVYTTATRLPTVRVDQHHLTQVLMGYVQPSRLWESGDLRTPKKLTEQLDTLFPLQTAHTLWSDRF